MFILTDQPAITAALLYCDCEKVLHGDNASP